MTPPFRQLLNRFAMATFERQLVLLDRLGDDHDWDLSLKQGKVRFTGQNEWGLQLLGTRADEDDTWRWAWATKSTPVAKEALEAVKKVRQVGRKRQVPELIEEEYPLDAVDLDAHTVAIAATGIAELPCYYRFPYPGGALFAALVTDDIVLGPAEPRRIAHVIREVTSRIGVEPRTAIETYLMDRGAKVERERLRVVGRWGNAALEVGFDEDGRLVSVGGEAHESAGLPA